MDCPVCKNEPMAVLEYDGVEVDYCVACQGIWLDAGELELLYGDEAAVRAVLAGDAAQEAGLDEAARPCPICGKPMLKARAKSDQPVTYDRCRAGHGLWFDKGELAAVLRGSAQFAHSAIAGFLGAVFAGDAACEDANRDH